ncbi:MAG: hypothetical protein RL497_1175 [Pseudomonadota bacterium]|jgi:hypothetical protein
MRQIVIFFSILLTSFSALAWDGWEAGVINSIEVTGAENYGFRIAFKGGPAMCGSGSPNWAYINKSNDNYQTYVSTLLAVALSAKRVIVYTIKNPADGQCQVGHISVLID